MNSFEGINNILSILFFLRTEIIIVNFLMKYFHIETKKKCLSLIVVPINVQNKFFGSGLYLKSTLDFASKWNLNGEC